MVIRLNVLLTIMPLLEEHETSLQGVRFERYICHILIFTAILMSMFYYRIGHFKIVVIVGNKTYREEGIEMREFQREMVLGRRCVQGSSQILPSEMFLSRGVVSNFLMIGNNSGMNV